MAVLFQVLVLFALLAVPDARAEVNVDALISDRILGNENAPVTIIEYSSFTCPHCATFHLETLPRIKQSYIETGKVRLIFRDFPLDARALAAAMVSRCVSPVRYYGFVELLFRDQNVWATSKDPLHDLKVRARLAQLSEEDFNACLQNEALGQHIEQQAREARDRFDIQSTPSFLVNNRKIRGGLPFDEFRKVIDAALGENKALSPTPEQTSAAVMPAADTAESRHPSNQ